MTGSRPILFSAPMVRALLAGTKTQTRRVVKPQPEGEWAAPGKTASPFGAPGDQLWVRETWANIALAGYSPTYFYRADGQQLPPRDARATHSTWRPSIFMPREASRITLDITAVRVERLQDISDADARAEGHDSAEPPRLWYQRIWTEINGDDSWNANPWVWVIQFKRAQP